MWSAIIDIKVRIVNSYISGQFGTSSGFANYCVRTLVLKITLSLISCVPRFGSVIIANSRKMNEILFINNNSAAKEILNKEEDECLKKLRDLIKGKFNINI